MKYIKTYEDAYLDYSSNGPAIVASKGDPSIGSYGGTNGGLISAEFKGGSSDPSAKGEEGRYKFTVKQIKYRKNPHKKSIKKLDTTDKQFFENNHIKTFLGFSN